MMVKSLTFPLSTVRTTRTTSKFVRELLGYRRLVKVTAGSRASVSLRSAFNFQSYGISSGANCTSQAGVLT